MREWLVVPYDGSAAAHATLRRAAAVAAASHRSCGLLLATVGLERPALTGPVAEVAEMVGPARMVAVVWLSPADPIDAFHALLAETDATLAVPLAGQGRAPWYAEACHASDTAARTMILFLTPHELQTVPASLPRPTRVREVLGVLRRGTVGPPSHELVQRAQDHV